MDKGGAGKGSGRRWYSPEFKAEAVRELARAEPEGLRAMILHIPARLVHHARARILKIEASWPWAKAFQACWQRLSALPDPG